MGFRFRKSINLGGGFKINLSKSGVGYSWGTKGFRVGKSASGRTRRTYSIPGTGISYVEEGRSRTNRAQQRSRNRNDYAPPEPIPVRQPQNNLRNIESADISNYQSAEFVQITKAIRNIVLLNKWGTALLFFAILIPAHIAFIIVPVIGIVLKIVVRKGGAVKLEYSFDAEQEEVHKRRIAAWQILAEGDKEWQVLTEKHHSNVKTNAGANRSLQRGKCVIEKSTPFYIRTNVETIQIKLKKETLIILPDKVFILNGSKVGAENYENVRISSSSVRFVEAETVPKDAQIIGYTWQYVNANGTPDRRFKNNRQFPICNYGVVTLRSDSGINVEMQVSNIQKCKDFDMLIR